MSAVRRDAPRAAGRRTIIPDLQRRFDVLDLARTLADVDDPGRWWSLDAKQRGRYEAMARVVLDLFDGENSYHHGFRTAIARINSAMAVLCLDCDEDVIEMGEMFMVRDDVWLEANPDSNGMLCVGCIEKRLGRRLETGDFTDVEINRTGHRSHRLRTRMSAEGHTEVPA